MSRKFYKEDNEDLPAIIYVEEIQDGFTEITNETELKRLYIGLYKQREIDGLNYFEDFRAGLMMDILSGLYTIPQVFELENHIKNLQSELIAGSWLTAQSTNSNLPLSGIYTQVFKDEIGSYINNYIINNY